MSNGLFEVPLGDPVLGRVGRGQLREETRRRAVWHPLPAQRAEVGPGVGKPAVARVLQLLHAHGQADVIGARGDGVDRRPEGLRAGGAEVLHPGDGDVGQPKGRAHRRGALVHVHLVHAGAHPGRLDVLLFDTRVGQAFREGLHHQLLAAHVPALTETGAAHSDDRDLVFDSRCHCPHLPPKLSDAFRSIKERCRHPLNVNSFPMSWDFMMSPSTFSFPVLKACMPSSRP